MTTEIKKPIKSPAFVNAVAMAKAHPDTFDVPPRSKREGVRMGQLVKVCCCEERFWVEVTGALRLKKIYTGRIDNDLVHTDRHGLSYDDLVMFCPDNIYAIYD